VHEEGPDLGAGPPSDEGTGSKLDPSSQSFGGRTQRTPQGGMTKSEMYE